MDGIDNRPKVLIRSHAQKHFIGLWKDDLPLPRVTEKWAGYTLSGPLLDPKQGRVDPCQLFTIFSNIKY